VNPFFTFQILNIVYDNSYKYLQKDIEQICDLNSSMDNTDKQSSKVTYIEVHASMQ